MFKNVFASGFLVRTAHVILTWVITLILFLHDTGMRRVVRLKQDVHVRCGAVLLLSCNIPYTEMWRFVFLKDLRKHEENGRLVQPVLFVLLVLVSVLLYFAVSLMDPGFILTDDNGLQVTRFLRDAVGISFHFMMRVNKV